MESKQPNILVVGGKIIAVTSLFVMISYWFLDRFLAVWVYQHHLRDYAILDWLTHIPVWVAVILIIGVLVVIARFAYRPLRYGERIWLAMSVSSIFAIRITELLKGVFGRYWPATWTQDNPSLLQNGAYGFHWFHTGAAYKSFPSGHTTVMVAAAAVLWLAYPHRRPLIAIIALLPLIGLLGMNYHFLGDIIGGIGVGSLTAYYTVKLMELKSTFGN